MSRVLQARREKASSVSDRNHSPPAVSFSPAAGLRLVRWSVYILLAAHFLLAHGCHGDEDNELLVRRLARWTISCGPAD